MKRRELDKIIRNEGEMAYALPWLQQMVSAGLPGGPVRITVGRPRRTLDQNAKLWPMLNDVSKQVEWYGQKLQKEEWKDVFTAALKRQKVVPGIDGGFVVVGMSTSRMPKQEFCDLVELIYAFGAEHGVEWSEPKKSGEELWKEAA